MLKLNEDYFLIKLMGLSFTSFAIYKLINDIFKINQNEKEIKNLTNKILEISNCMDDFTNKSIKEKSTKDVKDNFEVNNNSIFNFKCTQLISNLSYNKCKRKVSDYENVDIYKIVFTGGPCAGKTTAIANLSEKLRELGYVVFCIPEAASLIFQSGGDWDLQNYRDEEKIKFQYSLMTLQTNLEDSLTEFAFTNSNKKKIIICDRGIMDGSAYLSEDLWLQLIDEYNIDISRLRDKRYDLIIHWVSAADGAEKYFNFGNSARHEEMKYAKELDKNIQNAYMSHPNYYLIDNESQNNFKSKINNAISIVMKDIGIGESFKFKNKFFLRDPEDKLLDLLSGENINYTIFELEDLIIYENNEINIYRKRKTKENSFNYIKCTKSSDIINPLEIKRQITRREYQSIKNIQSQNKYKIKRQRINFTYNKKLIILDKFNLDNLKFMIMIEQTTDLSIKKGYPCIIEKNLYKNICDISEYSIEFLAKNGIKNFDENDISELKKFIN